MLGLVCEWPLIARADSHSTFAINNIVISPQPVGEFYLVRLFVLSVLSVLSVLFALLALLVLPVFCMSITLDYIQLRVLTL